MSLGGGGAIFTEERARAPQRALFRALRSISKAHLVDIHLIPQEETTLMHRKWQTTFCNDE